MLYGQKKAQVLPYNLRIFANATITQIRQYYEYSLSALLKREIELIRFYRGCTRRFDEKE